MSLKASCSHTISIWYGRLKIPWVCKGLGSGFPSTNCHIMVKTRLFRLTLISSINLEENKIDKSVTCCYLAGNLTPMAYGIDCLDQWQEKLVHVAASLVSQWDTTTCHECALSQIGTHPGVSLDVAKVLNPSIIWLSENKSSSATRSLAVQLGRRSTEGVATTRKHWAEVAMYRKIVQSMIMIIIHFCAYILA